MINSAAENTMISWTGPETIVDTLSYDAGDPLHIAIAPPGPSELMAGLGSWGAVGVGSWGGRTASAVRKGRWGCCH